MILITNAKIVTLWDKLPHAQAIAIHAGRILAVGSDQEIESLETKDVKPVDMGGKTIWPGLTDAHLHLENYALSLQRIDCETPTRAECLEKVHNAAQKAKSGSWIRGHGWNQNVWPEGFGTIQLLDQAAPYNPAYLTAKSLHAAWANTPALRLAGIDVNTPDPPGGRIQRAADGTPTGILLETAMQLVEQAIPTPSVAHVYEAIADAQPRLWQMGLTGVHDFDRRTCFLALQDLELGSRLKLRVLKSIPLEELDHAVALGLRSGFGSDRLRIGSVKCFADGALGPQTAAMLKPYSGSDDETGMLFLDSEEIYDIGQRAAESGLSLAVHAIGDRANHEVLSAYSQLRSFETQHHLPHLRHRIEHVQVLHADHLSHLAQLNIIASMQPIHATSDMEIADRFWGTRARYAYAFKTLQDNHTRLAFGSDAPVESPNPFWGIHAAVTRCRHNGHPAQDGWYPQERFDLQSSLESYTIHPAYTAGWENHLGRLAPGYFADLIVLAQDPFTLPTEQLFNLKPLATMVSGEWVWEA
jgi:predicted amidohydrolase YtcJ